MSVFDHTVGGSLYGELLRMQRDMDRMFGLTRRAARPRVFPAINIYDADDGYHLRAELPGIDPDSLDITVERNEVVIKGERQHPDCSDECRFHRREREFGKFSRAFAMPDNIDAERVKATYRDGVLDLLIGRVPEAGPRKVSVISEQ